MRGKLKSLDLVAAAFEFSFMGGSMGSVVGEKFVRGADIAIEHNIPMVCSLPVAAPYARVAILAVTDGQDQCGVRPHV